MATPDPNCPDCLEITRSQRECINCGGPVQAGTVELPGAPGGPGNAGPGPHSGWHCQACHALWDGGARYDFACGAHGGRDTPTTARDPRATIEPGTPMGDYPGAGGADEDDD